MTKDKLLAENRSYFEKEEENNEQKNVGG